MTEKKEFEAAVQVRHDYYRQPKYGNVERFISYQHQIATLRDSGVSNVLLIGVGDGLVPFYLKEVLGINVTTCDIDPELQPDIVADVRNLPCADASYDAVAVFEVLEHLPFEDFPGILAEISRVSKGAAYISLPYRNVAFEVLIKFPYIRTLLKRPWLHFIIKKPIKFLGFEYSKQHYWEIDTVTTKKVVQGVVSQFFTIDRTEHVVFDPYRYFLSLTKKPGMSNEYAKNYYDNFLTQLPSDYMSARWFSSPATQLDYNQTNHVLSSIMDSLESETTLEVGPGDGVWTNLLIPKTKKLTLLDQSVEMIKRAKERLEKKTDKITFINNDFLQYETTDRYDLIFAIRCFEYFEDKEIAMAKFASLLKAGGRVVVVTKNPEHIRMSEVQSRDLHRGQISQADMEALFKKHGFSLERTMSATWRCKASNLIMRSVFRALHWLHVTSNGLFRIPIVSKRFTESYVYVAQKK